MKYFLPELYVQLNSPDANLADEAEEAIEHANAEYNQRWKEIAPYLPPKVVRFYEVENLHDADVFAPAMLSQPMLSRKAGEVILVAQQINTLNADSLNTLTFLYYEGGEEPFVEIPVRSEVFNRVQPIWLYDEFDIVEPGIFTHSILISDGRVLTIRFHDFDYHLAKIIAPQVFKTLGGVAGAVGG